MPFQPYALNGRVISQNPRQKCRGVSLVPTSAYGRLLTGQAAVDELGRRSTNDTAEFLIFVKGVHSPSSSLLNAA